ncbi:type IV secretory system conjugative DNA transfer family protein [Streptomyces sp. NRRL S-920]|uniref:type IV secretory system conjugative DNA transfer family protein n=1 Tax=Streptomyces sp. NRRL S-920 TaxID=1463921 RepID=UPI0004CB1B7E|nr:type IV secretory system conjugative DNA transfer family protein [Streptomyces sp. NRRL S-920]
MRDDWERGGPSYGRERGARSAGAERGVPDGLLLSFLGFLLGSTVLVWTSTKLAARFARGAWPDKVTFGNTPVAVRHLIGSPQDLPGAWPATPPAQLPGYGLFWGLFIGQLMVLIVLMVFVMGTVVRGRAVRRARRAEGGYSAPGGQDPGLAPAPVPVPAPESISPPVPPGAPSPALESISVPAAESPPGPAAPLTPPASPASLASPAPLPTPTPRTPLILGTPAIRRPHAVQAVQDAEGAALVLTSDPTLWEETKDARAKLGPVLLYDPSHLCDTPARLHWSPTAGCQDKATAAQRAAALLAPVRPSAKLDAAVADTAETLMRSFLHAAAVGDRPMKHVHRWSQGTQVQEAVRILRTHPGAAPGAAGELEATLTAYPERRDVAQELTARALSALFTVHVRESCTPNRTDALTLDSFVHEGGTLFVVGEAIEDPKSRQGPGAMPLLTALASSVVEHGRRMAERSSSGRLDPPMTLVLDDAAAVAPLPQLPELLATGADRGLPTLALLRSREQGRSRWPNSELPV